MVLLWLMLAAVVAVTREPVTTVAMRRGRIRFLEPIFGGRRLTAQSSYGRQGGLMWWGKGGRLIVWWGP